MTSSSHASLSAVAPFEPIAIIGQGCVLPGAHSPEALWELVTRRDDLLSEAPEGYWGVEPERVMTSPERPSGDHTWSSQGGYVSGFRGVEEIEQMALRPEQVERLDPLFQWTLEAAGQAWRQAGYFERALPERAGVIVGNLSYPTRALSEFAAEIWRGAQASQTDALNRYMSGLPAQLVANALGLSEASAFCLDAACASSLYAVKLASDKLHDRSADLMLVGGVNRADDLFLHVGFCALKAMSRSGQSRPFHRHADGLVPAEGAGFVVLKRLEDALREGDPIQGVIRGVGLSNDGRGRGMLTPSEQGQWRAMRRAYAMSGLSPQDISLIECHATGTPLGDATELRSMAEIFKGGEEPIPIGSLKSNLGHLITASGVAGLLKVLSAMKHEQRPPTLHIEEPVEWLGETPFRLLKELEPWEVDGVRRAAVNNFGFGGNNAHLLVEEWREQSFEAPGRALSRPEEAPIAIVAMSARVADHDSLEVLAEALLLKGASPDNPCAPMGEIEIDITALRFPPNDLDQTLPQQLLALRNALELSEVIQRLPADRTGIYMGMQCDTEIARYGARWRLADSSLQGEALEAAREQVAPELVSAGVLGTMPNIVANRLNAQFDLLGPSFTVSAEQASGLVALQLAARALRHGELDAALVGAVDLCADEVHEAAARQALPAPLHRGGDAGVLLILKRLEDAERQGDTIWAVLDTPSQGDEPEAYTQRLGPESLDLAERFGHAHAASSMLHVAAAALLCRHDALLPSAHAVALPRLDELSEPHCVLVSAEPLLSATAQRVTLTRHASSPSPRSLGPARLVCFAAPSFEALQDALKSRQSLEIKHPYPQHRLALIAPPGELEACCERALEALARFDEARRSRRVVKIDDAIVYGQGAPLHRVALRLPPLSATPPPRPRRALLLALPQLAHGFEAELASLYEEGAAQRFSEEGAQTLRRLDVKCILEVLRLNVWTGLAEEESSWLNERFDRVVTPRKLASFQDDDQLELIVDLERPVEKSWGEPRQRESVVFPVEGSWQEMTEALGELFAQGVDADWRAWPAYLEWSPREATRRAVIKRYPAHLPKVNLPQAASPRPLRVASHEPRSFERAPKLPDPVHDASTYARARALSPYGMLAPPAGQIAPAEFNMMKKSEPAAPPAPRPRVEPEPAHTTTSAASLVAAHFERLSALHQDFLDRQATLQREFLDARAQLTGQLAALSHQPAAPRRSALLSKPSPQGGAQSGARGEDIALVQPLFAASSSAHRAERAERAGHHVIARQSEPEEVKSVERAQPAQPAQPAWQRPARPVPSVQPVPSVRPAQPAASAPSRAPKNARANLRQHQITPSAQKLKPVGPTFDSEQVAVHASGKISEIFGPRFAVQDDWRVQVRMPEPPLLLCHRVTGIDCPLGEVSTGTLWCESDIPQDAWYLHEGRMPVGIMIESGQADLMLISYMGADFENRGERVYRLLGCELMFHGGLARPGDVLKYDIHIDGHAKQDAIRLFFFHYDLEIDDQVRLSVRNGQAGFFSYEELAESNGILWRPEDEDAEAIAQTPWDAPPCVTEERAFSADAVQRFSQGQGFEVFGPGFEKIAAHTSTPRIQADRMRFMDEVVEFNPRGGPWGRGYMKATQAIQPDDWFFDGHFLNDPCMPGTLMFEGCVQAMGFYMAACGWTVERDGWVFEPVPFEAYPLRCRGQVTPQAKEVTYEVLVREVHGGEIPKLYADLMCTVDGLKAFHCGRMGLQLTPAWPMDRMPELLSDHEERVPVATSLQGHRFGLDSLLACAWGKPTRAFGEMYAPFDSHRRVARLPGPPYHFISRVTELDPTAQNAMRSGVSVAVQYDVPEEAWYFQENGAEVMPYAVLLEAALQPCGWLASYVGCALTRDDLDLAFRNLDGTTTQLLEVTPETGTLTTRATLKNIARAAGNIIVSFDVEMRERSSDRLVLTMDTVFGFFPPEALSNQSGLPVSPAERAQFDAAPHRAVDLSARPELERSARLAGPMLLMLDRVTVADPQGGEQGLGFYRAEKDVDPNEWFFKAHFFQDPVQPGSLGLEALLQLLQFAMLDQELDQGLKAPRFEAVARAEPLAWKYRGQVLTHNTLIASTLTIERVVRGDNEVLAYAQGSLWVDGMRIYHSPSLAMRLVSDGGGGEESLEHAPKKKSAERELTLHLEREGWLRDHRPTYADAALPMMSIVDLLMQQARASAPETHQVIGLDEVTLKRWVIVKPDRPARLRTRSIEATREVVLERWRELKRVEMSRFDEIARARVITARAWPEATSELEPLGEAAEIKDPYQSGELFHGPAFQMLEQVRRNARGASGLIDLARDGVPPGAVRPGALDAALQILPHDAIESWWPEHPGEVIAYPHTIKTLRFYGETPQSGTLRSEARFVSGQGRFATSDVEVFSVEAAPDAAGQSDDDAPRGRLWMSMRLSEVLLPKGPLGRLEGRARRAFIQEKRAVAGAALSQVSEHGATLSLEQVQQSNWFQGTLEALYEVGGTSSEELTRRIVAKDLVAARFAVHPSRLEVLGERVALRASPLHGVGVSVAWEEKAQRATASWSQSVPAALEGTLPLDLEQIASWWQRHLGVPQGWLGGDLYKAMLERFVQSVVVDDPLAIQALKGQPVMFLGNHEVQIESLLVTLLGSVLTDTVVITMANAKHERGWVGHLVRELFAYPGCKDPRNIVYFDQSDPASMFKLLESLKREVKERGTSLMVHAPGTRARRAGERVERVSSALLDLALELDLAIVPVSFSGGLPKEPVGEEKLEFPVHQTGQRYRFGRPLQASVLKELAYGERRRAVLSAINDLAPAQLKSGRPQERFEQEIEALRSRGMNEIDATLWHLLAHHEPAGEDLQALLGGGDEALTPERAAWLAALASRFVGRGGGD